MKRIALIVMVFVLSISIASVSIAHSGRTDGNGGHWNHSTGEYHYHHGKPAHDHVNGVCPYDFEDTTNHSSGASQSSVKHTAKKEKPLGLDWWETLILGGCAAWFLGYPAGSILCILWYLLSRFLKFDHELLPNGFFIALGVGVPLVVTALTIIKQVTL